MIHLQRVVKSYNNRIILDNIDLSFTQHHNHVILGPSGVGKSTLLKIISGQLPPDSGKVLVNGHELLSNKERKEYLKSIGYVYQRFNLLENMTIWDNVILPLKIQKKVIHPQYVEELLNDAGILEERNKYPNQLSGGQQQRVGIVRALVHQPSLLLCDEPTSALDFETSKKLIKTLDHITAKHKTTLIVVTHDLQVAENIATKIHRLEANGITSSLNSSKLKAVI